MESMEKKDQEKLEEEKEEVQMYDLENCILSESRKNIKWWLFLLNCFMLTLGIVGGPLVLRFYYLHGGSRKWIPTWLQSAGFPVLFIPLAILYYRSKTESEPTEFFAGTKLMLCSAGLGLLQGVVNFMISTGLSYLPLSTSTILFATQLAFTAIFAFIVVQQKFTPFSINAVILMTLGSILLTFGKGGDRPMNVSQGQYLIGFFLTLAASALLGLYLPLAELSYAKGGGKRMITYTIVTQVQLVVGLSATIFSTVGMLINHDFQAIPREAKEFGLGEANYYMILVLAGIVFEFVAIGSLSVVFCASSLFCGILTSSMIPVSELIACIVFKEKFTGVKGMSLAMCLWGVVSYFYGEYRTTKKMKEKLNSTIIASDSSHGAESALHRAKYYMILVSVILLSSYWQLEHYLVWISYFYVEHKMTTNIKKKKPMTETASFRFGSKNQV